MATSFREAEYAGWTACAESYDTLFTTISNQAIPHILSALGDLSGKAVLDVCCGPGHLAAAAVQRGASAEGIDFAPTMIARAARNYPTIPFHEGDAESLPYGSGSFDHASAPLASCACSSQRRRLPRLIASFGLAVFSRSRNGLSMMLSEGADHIDVVAIWRKTGLSQLVFAGRIGVPVSTLRNWEQGHPSP